MRVRIAQQSCKQTQKGFILAHSGCVSQKISLLNTHHAMAYTEMAATRYSANVLEMFYGRINLGENNRLQRPILLQEEATCLC